MSSLFSFLLVLTALIFDRSANAILSRTYGRCNVDLPEYDTDGADNSINLYRNAKDMIALSQYIYQHAAMIKDSQEVKSPWFNFWSKYKPENVEFLKNISANNDRSVGDVLKIGLENKEFLEKNKDRKVREATKVISNDLEEGDATDATKASIILAIHADKEDIEQSCVYAITVNHKLKRISVIFRGTSNMGDWVKDVLVFLKNKDNPVKDLVSLIPRVGIHGGFAEAILRKGKIERMLDELKSHLKEFEGYRLFVTGHSLGGALATIFGFYAAADEEISNSIYGPVALFSVSSPRVGNTNFLESFKYLEEKGKLRHARIRNAQDKVTRVPFFGSAYKHVGIEIRLHSISRHLSPVLDYPIITKWVQKGNGIWNSIISLPDALRLHGCDLIRSRVKFSKAFF